jgi:hypothetical protein
VAVVVVGDGETGWQTLRAIMGAVLRMRIILNTAR